MAEDIPQSVEKAELDAAIERVLRSSNPKKLVVAGPGTGKTTLFKQMLELAEGEPDRRLVLTFINNLRDDLEKELSGLAEVRTLHSFCLGLLYQSPLRGNLSSEFQCHPGLGSLIREDWEFIRKTESPHFIREMRNLEEHNQIAFYLERGEYYDAVDFDDTVYRTYNSLVSNPAVLDNYDLVLVDEYQDFNRLEAGIIEILSETSPILIAGDDDQALYSQLRDSSSEYIRSLHDAGEYEVFELPFCMRCPKVVVEAVSDIITKARQLRRLEGRIPKPYRHFPPAKAIDSAKYPKIALVETTVQRQNANYMGRYIEQAIKKIPRDEIDGAARGGYPTVLVIVARPYRDQIVSHLQSAGYTVDTRQDTGDNLNRGLGLSILKANQASNLGWRIVLRADAPPFLSELLVQTADKTKCLVDIVPAAFREKVLAEVNAYQVPDEEIVDTHASERPVEIASVRVTSFEGAKGLSAQHVFIAGLHDSELPHNAQAIQDLEICKFIVGLTRTRKSCTLIYTDNFAGNQKSPSCFISWISADRLQRIKVDAAYWKK